MTAKLKAEELVDKYKYIYDDDGKLYLHTSINISKRYALIAVDEMLKVLISYAGREYDYYLEVKQEIEKL
tara:strand:- start:70 stop:279 length:210 start_codon:yes stop_codon:yes gene_type:complete